MQDIENIINKKNSFIGMIGTSYPRLEHQQYRQGMKKYFQTGGSMIYIYSFGEESYSIKYFRKAIRSQMDDLIEEGRFKSIDRAVFIQAGDIDVDKLVDSIAREVDKLLIKGSTKNQVYITLDSSWNLVEGADLDYLYQGLVEMNQEGKTGVIFRYVMEGLSFNCINYLLKYHKSVVVDMVDRYDYLPLEDLLAESLTLLVEHKALGCDCGVNAKRNEGLRVLGELMESTIHDINNLLVTILGYAQLSRYVDDMAEIKDYLGIITKTAMDGKVITDRIKEHTRGNYESAMDVYEFDYIIDNCIEMVKHKFKSPDAAGNNVKLEIDLNAHSYVYANEYDIRHAIANIVLNGVDAMEGKGTLTIKTYHKDGYIMLEISDTGNGMDENTRNHIFTPHFTTKGTKGTGLGLWIAKKAFQNHNGDIEVESKLGQGTKFIIRIPAIGEDKDIF